jgi:glycosyltransferase involved in cell wall biosynthesis
VFRARHGVAPDEVCILLVNRNYRDPGKGFAAAARALQTAPPEKARVLVAGHESPWALAQIPLAGVDKGFVASRRELAELYEVADIFLFASPMENFPCVILEAMAAQCCIVATPTAGVLEQVEHEKTALLSPAMTGVGLGATLRRAMDDAGLRHQLGAQARAQVEREYSLDVMVRRHLELYAQLITERNQTHSPPVN